MFSRRIRHRGESARHRTAHAEERVKAEYRLRRELNVILSRATAECSAVIIRHVNSQIRENGIGFHGPQASVNLTRRQQQILELILTGKTNKEIGCVLNITERTVKMHVSDVLRRFNVTSRMELFKI